MLMCVMLIDASSVAESASVPPRQGGMAVVAPGAVSKKGGGKKSGKGRFASGNAAKPISKICKMASVRHLDKKKLCGAFNTAKGCTNQRQCPQWGIHCCAYIVADDGTICGKTDHGYQGHS